MNELLPEAYRCALENTVDVYDALTTCRPYKEAWSEERALEELMKQRGVHFDPEIVDALASLHGSGVLGEIRQQFP